MRGFSTNAIHAGQEPDPSTGDVITPIHVSSTFAQDGVGGLRSGYEYSRSANPTRTALQECLAALEGGRHAVAFGSGMGASDVLMRVLLKPGDHVVIPHDAYGGTFRLVDKVLALWGVEYTPVDLADIGALRAALRPTTRVVWCETPTNPLLGIADIAAVADVSRTAGARLVVDNTFASPYLQQPLALGADVVLHSTTKYVGGHSDVVGGALVTGDDELADAIRFTQNSVGSVPGPFDAWLTLRGVKTLAVRMERHSDNAERIAELLAAHPAVTRVYYPGLAEHPGHEIAAKQMRRFGGMVSFTVAGGRDAALRVCAATEIFTLAESLGGVESLIEHPGAMTHASVAGSALEVPDDLVRLSVGIEDVEDLAEDLRQALSAADR
ncbi:cystathionine gamma-synthase [Pseudonocardia cypriaca]|uniref:Cystathionine gamma-synthase n=1 Tax=Pseudonocardia cypriaca TaxID=882449 RepID=A0A543FY90_9PSEU|nr:cystathionine gamma-synthase [Pseudonocardia cypriaca]TQM38795.1 cystathionine gamma-synthase [Pseudonocardia cypriaca]